MAVAILGLQVTNKFLHVVGVIMQMKLTFCQWHCAGIFPIGDVDLVIFEHGAHSVAQQRGVVARQRRNNQYCRLVFKFLQSGNVIGEALEANQITKRFAHFDALIDRNFNIAHFNCIDAEFRLQIIFAQTVHQIVARRHALHDGILAEWRFGVAQNFGRCLGKIDKRLHQ